MKAIRARVGTKLRSLVLVLLGIASTLAVAYVLYAHLASFSRRPEYATRGFDLAGAFTEASLRETFAIETDGLEAKVKDGVVQITGPAGKRLTLVGKPTRLGDAVDVSLGFRAACTDCTVALGLRSEEHPDRDIAVRWEQSGEGGPGLAVRGDAYPIDERLSIERALPVPPNERSAWHDLTFRTSSAMSRALFVFDGSGIGGVQSGWRMGVLVRPTITVFAGKSPADVEVRRIAYDRWELKPEIFDAFRDRFQGAIVDPRKWIVTRTERELADVDVTTGKEGLTLRAVRTDRMKFPGAVEIRTRTFFLRSFCATAQLADFELDHASIVLGLHGSGTGHYGERRADIGIVQAPDINTVAFFAGHVTGDAQVSSSSFGPASPPVVLKLCFDDASRRVRAQIDERAPLERVLDLFPLDEADIALTVNLDAPGAKARVVVREFTFDPR